METEALFVSYASTDWDGVSAYLDALRQVGLDVWLDHRDIEPSDSIVERLSAGIAATRYAVVFYSRGYEQSMWTREELHALLHAAITAEHERRVFVVRLDDSPLPSLIRHRRWFERSEPKCVATAIREVIDKSDGFRDGRGGLEVGVDDLTPESVLALASHLRDPLESRDESACSEVTLPGPKRVKCSVVGQCLTEDVRFHIGTWIDVARTNTRVAQNLQRQIAKGIYLPMEEGLRIQREEHLQGFDEAIQELRRSIESVVASLTVVPRT